MRCGEMPEPVVVPTRGEAMGSRYHARVALIYAIETSLDRRRRGAGGDRGQLFGSAEMGERALGVADYPLAEKRPELIEGRRGKRARRHHARQAARRRGGARRSAHHAGGAAACRRRSRAPRGARCWRANFKRAAELVDVPQDFIMAVYELLRPGRAKDKEPLLEAAGNCATNTRRSAWPASSRRPPKSTAPRAFQIPVLTGPHELEDRLPLDLLPRRAGAG